MAHRCLSKTVGHRKQRPTIACITTIRTRGSWLLSTRCHLDTRYTDGTGRGMNLAYDSTEPSAKAIRE
jgi:hypothetical protein